MSYSSQLLLMKQVNDESISPGTWSNQDLILHAHMYFFSEWSVSPSYVSFRTSSSNPEDEGNPRWHGRRFLAENTLGFMKDGGDERLPRFLSRAVALSKGCIGHGFRLHGQRRVSSYYYWDSHDIQPHRIRFSPRQIAPSGPLKTCLLTYLSQTKKRVRERKTELVRSELYSTSSFLLRPLTPVCWIVSENSDVTPPFYHHALRRRFYTYVRDKYLLRRI
ncbi:hypothetical protein J3E69DRAFT_6551 [Trichoderma sp. SZMC 28015]